jgi:hypothetical protein
MTRKVAQACSERNFVYTDLLQVKDFWKVVVCFHRKSHIQRYACACLGSFSVMPSLTGLAVSFPNGTDPSPHAIYVDRKDARMPSRPVIVTLLLCISAGCENQGKAAGASVVDELCRYRGEAIRALGCKSETAQGKASSDQFDYFVSLCKQEHRVVAPRCQIEQKQVLECLVKAIEAAPDRNTAFAEWFQCETTTVTWTETSVANTMAGASSTTGGAGNVGAESSSGGVSARTVQEIKPNGNAVPKMTLEDSTVYALCNEPIRALGTCTAAPPVYAP